MVSSLERVSLRGRRVPAFGCRMGMVDNFRLALQTFWGHRLRSTLTLLGIVIGVATVEAMVRAGATCLAVAAGKTLLFDLTAILASADAAGIALVAE